jgi:hypothetical protein
LSAADDIESLLETEPADLLPTAAQPTSPQEDLDDLFEPLPLEHEARPAVAGTATPESARQMFSRELPPPAFSSPVHRPRHRRSSVRRLPPRRRRWRGRSHAQRQRIRSPRCALSARKS